MTLPTQANQAIRARLERDMDVYLSNGGKITQLPPCTLSDTFKKNSESKEFIVTRGKSSGRSKTGDILGD